jgi:hypothetical protein
MVDVEQLELEQAEREITAACLSLFDPKKVEEQQLAFDLCTMVSPPPQLRNVIEGLCVLCGIRPVGSGDQQDYWLPCKRDILCNTRVFRFYVTNFDKDSIPEAVLKRVGEIVCDPDFDADYVRRESEAAAEVSAWIAALVKYNRAKTMRLQWRGVRAQKKWGRANAMRKLGAFGGATKAAQG